MPIVEYHAYVSEMPSGDLSVTRAYLRVIKKYGRLHSFMLESIFDEKSTSLAKRFSRLSIITCDPLLIIESKGNKCSLSGSLAKEIAPHLSEFKKQQDSKGSFSFSLPEGKDPLDFMKSCMSQITAQTGVSRFSFGPIGFTSYDIVRFFEKLPDKLPDKRELPDLCFVLHRNAVIFDHSQNRLHFVTHVREGEKSALPEFMSCVMDGKEEAIKSGGTSASPVSNTTESQYAIMVRKAIEHIKAGDIFQTVLARKFAVKTSRDPISIYFDLRTINPSPYLFYLDFGAYQLFGSSPEIQVRLENGEIEMRPIAGTRGRGKDEKDEERISKELLGNEKERAEHTMLVDLCRNDVGRVAEFGSVKEPDPFVIEKYSHVQHIVSHVTGKLKAGKDAFDVFRATFPAGTVSGAPKVRAMEIIESLEAEKRGPYGGVVGYFDLKGNMDTCIAIRSVVMKDGVAYVGAGAGIVLDSDPKSEFLETRRKANACLKAITGKDLTEG